ncbi:MAG: hypothetical protein FWG04_05555 [Desulfovibrionaceae bacterium]|nr:hypothetical protein [Desulfovibrionaceae bacterium]
MSKQVTASDVITRLNAKAAAQGLQVITAQALATGKESGKQRPDVLILSQPSPMADTGCMFLVPVAGRGAFTRAAALTLNGVSGFIGPAPNERLGVVDIMFTADMTAENNTDYTGRHLFSDVLRGKEIAVWCRSMEATEHTGTTVLGRMQFARFTVFDAPLDPELAGLLKGVLYTGNTLLLNGGLGFISGTGARDSAERPSLAVIADLFPMQQDTLLFDNTGVLAGHNLTLAVPLALVSEPEAVLARAVALASLGGEEVRSRLAASENLLAEAVATGKQRRLVDAGP